MHPRWNIPLLARLWDNMEPTHDNLKLHKRVQGYRLIDGTPVWCLCINYPSGDFLEILVSKD
jgi:hypothetical protein